MIKAVTSPSRQFVMHSVDLYMSLFILWYMDYQTVLYKENWMPQDFMNQVLKLKMTHIACYRTALFTLDFVFKNHFTIYHVHSFLSCVRSYMHTCQWFTGVLFEVKMN